MDRRRFLGLATLTGAATLLPATRAGAAPASGSIPRPVAGLVTRWDVDPWARGSYSALPVGCSPANRRILRDAVIGQRIFFAGEYASLGSPSTTTGAYESGQLAARRVLDRVDPDSVIVIGAGMAGAAAAAELAAADVEVTVLEARDRIGGRVFANQSWGAPVELGAAWIHGVAGNPMTAQAAASQLRLVATDYGDEIIRDTVTGMESPSADAAQSRLDNLVERLGDDESPADMSVARWLAAHDWPPPDRFGAWAQATTITQEYGLDPNRLAAVALQEGGQYDDGDALVAGNYASIPTRLLNGIDVRLRTPGRGVELTSAGVSVRTDHASLTADAVIVAVPIALLKAGIPRISPMPSRVRAAIARLATGNLEKVVLRYDRPWWTDFATAQVYGVVGGGAPGAPPRSLAALRWTEFYPLTDVIGFPALVGFAGGQAARARPASDGACIAEAVAALDAAFRT